MSQYIIDAVVKKGHVEIIDLPLPDDTKVHVIVKSKKKKSKKEKRVDEIMSMLPKHKMGKELLPIDRKYIYE